MKIRHISVPRRWSAPRVLVLALLALPLAATSVSWPLKAAAAEENRILTATKSALYGGAAGLLLGGVAALVAKRDDRDNAIRWGVVVGTFGGFAYGLYDVTHHKSDFSLRPPRDRGATDLAGGPRPGPAGKEFGRNSLDSVRPDHNARSLGRCVSRAPARPDCGPTTSFSTLEMSECGRSTR